MQTSLVARSIKTVTSVAVFFFIFIGSNIRCNSPGDCCFFNCRAVPPLERHIKQSPNRQVGACALLFNQNAIPHFQRGKGCLQNTGKGVGFFEFQLIQILIFQIDFDLIIRFI